MEIVWTTLCKIFDNLDEMYTFSETHKLPNLTQKET